MFRRMDTQYGGPSPRSGHMAETGEDGTIYFFGGQGKRRHSTLHCFTPADGVWVEVDTEGAVPPPLCKGSLTYLEGSLYLFGGWGEGRKKLNTMWRITPGVWVWEEVRTAGRPPPRSSHSCAVVGAKMILFGGIGDNKYNDLWQFDPKRCAWSPISCEISPPRRSSYGGLHLKGNALYLFGGLGCGQFNDVWRLQLPEKPADKFFWTEVKTTGSAPSKRGRHSTAIIGDMLLTVAGTNLRRCFADAHALNLNTNEWTEIPLTKYFAPKEACAVVTTDTGFYLHGGMQGAQTWFDDMWEVKAP